MNGRLYDSKLHRFLQPDNYVQDPSNTQNFNRYGYCYNNPLKYSDENGEWAGLDDLGAFLVGGLINWGMNGFQLNAGGFAYFMNGGLSGLATLYGGNFWQGAVTGLVVSGLTHFSQKMKGYEDANYDPTKVSKSNSDDVANGDVINMHNDGSALDQWARQSKPANGEVEVHAHGNELGFGGMYKLDEIKAFLYDKSPTWRAMVDYGKKITLKLYACNTGSGSNSIAKQISMAFKNVTVVAPTNYWRVHYIKFSFFRLLDYGSVRAPGRWKSFKQ